MDPRTFNVPETILLHFAYAGLNNQLRELSSAFQIGKRANWLLVIDSTFKNTLEVLDLDHLKNVFCNWQTERDYNKHANSSKLNRAHVASTAGRWLFRFGFKIHGVDYGGQEGYGPVPDVHLEGFAA